VAFANQNQEQNVLISGVNSKPQLGLGLLGLTKHFGLEKSPKMKIKILVRLR